MGRQFHEQFARIQVREHRYKRQYVVTPDTRSTVVLTLGAQLDAELLAETVEATPVRLMHAKETYECMQRGLLTAAARAQLDAALLAEQFNRRLRGPACWYVSFLPVCIYKCWDINYVDETAWVLVEPELDGKFTKWNNNAGAVLRTGCDTGECAVGSDSLRSTVSKALGAITEDDEEEQKEGQEEVGRS